MLFFPDQSEFRNWLAAHHETAAELVVGFYKKDSGNASMTWSESVDQALCFGWIDGVRRRVDDESYSIRFTPRRPTSIWSAVNIAKVEELTAKGLMMPAGIAAFAKRRESHSKIYAFESELKELPAEYLERFTINEKAWDFFQKQANWYKKQMIHWVVAAKQEATRERRLEMLMAASEKQERC